MVRHDRQRSKWNRWLPLVAVLSSFASPAAAQNLGLPDDPVEIALAEAARAREEGNCLAHGLAVGEAYRLVDEWARNWPPGTEIEAILNRMQWAEALRRVIAGERDQPCGGVDPRSDAVMADMPSESPPPELQPLLDRHNAEREEVGAPSLVWSAQLETTATGWARHLATIGRLEHSPREGRGTERENLQQLLPGTDPQEMLLPWVSEKTDFVPGLFPDVSRTGDWNDTSHFTQMIWPGTTELGCGVASGGGYDWLVCRYNPGGNRDGQPVGMTVEGTPPAASSSERPVIVYFDLDGYLNTPATASVHDGVAIEYKRTAQARLQIQSNTADGASGDLLFNRLANVRSYLIGKGVPEAALASGDVAIDFARGQAAATQRASDTGPQ
jgi:hypothetical protein